jgi:hypothetical protein
MVAVISLQKALGCGEELVEPEEIGRYLADIEKNHPEEYKRGIEEYFKTLKAPQ